MHEHMFYHYRKEEFGTLSIHSLSQLPPIPLLSQMHSRWPLRASEINGKQHKSSSSSSSTSANWSEGSWLTRSIGQMASTRHRRHLPRPWLVRRVHHARRTANLATSTTTACARSPPSSVTDDHGRIATAFLHMYEVILPTTIHTTTN